MKKQKTKTLKMIATAIMACAFLLGLVSPVMAAEVQLSAIVSQSIESTNDEHTAENIAVSYVLTAENDAPMPEGTEDGRYSFIMTGNDHRKLEIKYDTVGEYGYILERTDVSGAGQGTFSGNPRKVRILNTVYGEDEFSIVTVVYILDADSDVGKKMQEFRFQYTYNAAPTSTPTSTPIVTRKPVPTTTTKPVPTTRPTRTPATLTPAGGWAGLVDAVKTGDESNPVFYLILMAAAGAVCLGCILNRYR